MKLIGFAGKAGVGKSSISTELQKLIKCNIYAFADPLKQGLSVFTGEPIYKFTDIKFKEKVIDWIGKSPRELMQYVATDVFRNNISSTFWVDRMRNRINNTDFSLELTHYENIKDVILIDDIRFDDEADLIRELNGTIVHLERTFKSPTNRTEHSSENGIMMYKTDVSYNLDNESIKESANNILDLLIKE